MGKVKHINFKVEFEGHGIVNYDSGDQKYLWNRESKEGNKNKFTSADNNNNYAKKHYYRDSDGVLRYKIKVSADALRNAIFRGDAIATNPSISHHKTLLNSFIGSTLGLVRGYMFTKGEALNRKSALTITSAIQTNNAESYMEFHSRSGGKKVGDDSGEGDTTVFIKETIGDITYESKGFINLQDLEFLSCDPIFARCSFNSDDFEILKMFLSKTLPNFNSNLGYYNLKTSAIDVAEYGIKLNKENIIFLIKETLKRILNISIERSGAYLKTKQLTIQLVHDPLKPENNINIVINNIDDINNLSFDVEESYILSDEAEAKLQRLVIEEAIMVETKAKQDSKAAAKKSKTVKTDTND